VSHELVRLRVLILRLPVDPVLEIHYVKDLKVTIAWLAVLQLVDILPLKFEAVEISLFGRSTDTAELLHREIYLLLLKLAHIAAYLCKLCDRRIDVHSAEDEYSVGRVARCENLRHDLPLLHCLDLTIRQLDSILKECSRVCLTVNSCCA
jgi:hypothetical protein